MNSTPDRFSPGAVLRPICQDAILPVAAIISGPSEILYLEQIKPAYQLFNITRSIPWPRASFTIIDHRTMRVSEKEKLPLEKMFSDPDHIRLELAKDTFPFDIKNKLDVIENKMDSDFNYLAEKIGSINPSLIESIKKDKGRILHIMKGIEDRALRAHKSSIQITEKRFAAVSHFLMPENGLQERYFGFDLLFSISDKKGFDELINLTSPEEEYHRIVVPEKN